MDSMSKESSTTPDTSFDVIIIGAGFSGIYMLYRMVNLGLKVRLLEEASGAGGTWYWNRYPGARCDIESMEYSYSFSEQLQQEWKWTDKYSSQPEILEYAKHVVERFDLSRFIAFDSRVASATYDENETTWVIELETGQRYHARYCVMATGTLSSVNAPDFPGLESYRGARYLTGRWPEAGVDLTGKHVGIIGTGSTAIQAIPMIAKEAGHLTVFQRTANYSIPARNRPLDAGEVATVKADYPSIRAAARASRGGTGRAVLPTQSAFDVSEEERYLEYERRWRNGGLTFLAAYTDIASDDSANETAAEFVRQQIRKIVSNPTTAELLSPKDTIGCKRLCLDSEYFETFNRENVTLVDIQQAPINRFVETGIETENDLYQLDAIIFAMGFDALTGALLAIDIKGKSGRSLRDKWSDGPRAYLGLVSEGFPNMFTVTGPGSPSVLSNMMTSIEQHVDWITECIQFIEAAGMSTIDADLKAEDEWMDHVEEVASKTLRYGCNSWYLGANIEGKKRIFMPYAGGVSTYAEKCAEIASEGYRGFTIV